MYRTNPPTSVFVLFLSIRGYLLSGEHCTFHTLSREGGPRGAGSRSSSGKSSHPLATDSHDVVVSLEKLYDLFEIIKLSKLQRQDLKLGVYFKSFALWSSVCQISHYTNEEDTTSHFKELFEGEQTHKYGIGALSCSETPRGWRDFHARLGKVFYKRSDVQAP